MLEPAGCSFDQSILNIGDRREAGAWLEKRLSILMSDNPQWFTYHRLKLLHVHARTHISISQSRVRICAQSAQCRIPQIQRTEYFGRHTKTSVHWLNYPDAVKTDGGIFKICLFGFFPNQIGCSFRAHRPADERGEAVRRENNLNIYYSFTRAIFDRHERGKSEYIKCPT